MRSRQGYGKRHAQRNKYLSSTLLTLAIMVKPFEGPNRCNCSISMARRKDTAQLFFRLHELNNDYQTDVPSCEYPFISGHLSSADQLAPYNVRKHAWFGSICDHAIGIWACGSCPELSPRQAFILCPRELLKYLAIGFDRWGRPNTLKSILAISSNPSAKEGSR